MKKTGFFLHEECFWHTGGNYALTVPVGNFVQPLGYGGLPENPETKRRLKNLIEISGLSKELIMKSSPRANIDEMSTVHTRSYLDKFAHLSEEGGGELGLRVPFGPGGFDIASRSAGLVLSAVNSVLRDELDNAYALARPPGHHCLADFPNGFCMLNNIAIAVRVAQKHALVNRVVILDWDVHHGNGTESIFYDDPNVFTISIHQERNYPLDTGFFEHRGQGDGLNFNLNIPLPPGSGDCSYMEVMNRLVEPAIQNFKPEIIIVACGFDASGVDPLSRMLCSSVTFQKMTKSVMDLASEVCSGKVVMAHEGGYSEVHVPFCGHAVIREMAGSSIYVEDPLHARIDAQQPSKDFNRFVQSKICKFEEALF